MNPDNYDIFLSYEQQIENKVITLQETLSRKYGVCITFEINEDHLKAEKAIFKSKIFICCLTGAYVASKRCMNEMYYAYMKDKPSLVLMFERLTAQDLTKISITRITKFNIYDDSKLNVSWEGTLFEQIIKYMEFLLKRKLKKKPENRKKLDQPESRPVSVTTSRPTSVTSSFSSIEKYLKPAISNVISSTTYNDDTKEVIIESIEADEYGLMNEEKYHQTHEIIEAESIELVHTKSNSLVDSVYGFNRVVYLESRERYLITSSYNNSVISVDADGKWIEKRNPGRLLRQPWAICLNKSDEIFIGDNELKRIFVFDAFWKHLATFGENVLSGFFDMTIDSLNDELYAVGLYDSLLVVFDLRNGRLKKKVLITMPAYVRVTSDQIFVLSSTTDLIYCINKTTLEVLATIRIERAFNLNGLFIDDFSNIFTTASLKDETGEKSKEIYLIYVTIKETGICIKQINLLLTQVNDFAYTDKKHMVLVSDTHVDIFQCTNFNKLNYI